MLELLAALGFYDPGTPGLFRSREAARALECEHLSLEEGLRLEPGAIDEPKPRGDYARRAVVVCRERALRGIRSDADEAILATLEASAATLTEAAVTIRPDLAERTWLVEPFHPSVQVSGKIAFATKNALMAHGVAVSDRAPMLAAGDVDVLTRMGPDEAYPAACRRWHDNGSLTEDHALLAVLQRDPRETALHAGLCADGGWTWLR